MTQRYIDIAFDDATPRSFGGFDNENEATVIRLKVLTSDAKYYLEIERACAKHDKYCSDALPVADGYAVFEVPRDFTHETLYVQGVMKVDGMCRKTARVRVGFSRSINALDELPESHPSWADSIEKQLGNLDDLTTKDKGSLVAAINETAKSGGGAADAVTYTPQTLTKAQQEQARANISAEKAGAAYTKPASGIPKTDLAYDVQTSLAKADTAISLGLTAATPGQIIKVKAVQDGKPTAWEAVDMPSGGGEDWTLLAEQTTTEIVKEISFTLPKSVKHVVSKIWCPATGAETVNRYINVKIGASYLFYYIAPNIPDKSMTSQLTVSADSIGGGYWRLSYYANRGDKVFDGFSGYNQNESVVVGVGKATNIEANTFAIMVVATDTAQQFPVGTILKVWGY